MASPPAFQPNLTVGVTRAHLPKLAYYLDHLEEAHGFDCDTSNYVLLTFVRFYSVSAHQASHLSSDGPSPEVTSNIEYCEDMLSNFVKIDQRMHKCTAKFPTFQELWDELWESFSHIDIEGDSDDLCGVEVVHGRNVKAYEAFAFEYLQHCDPKYTRLIRSILQDQPAYSDLPSDYDDYVSNRLAGGDPFPGLKKALRPFIYDQRRCSMVLTVFGSAMALTVDLFQATSFTPTPAQVTVLEDEVAREWTSCVENFMRGVSKNVRETMAGVNARGVAEALVHRCRELLQQHQPYHLGWYLHVWFFGRAIIAFEENPADSAWLKEMLPNWPKIHPDLILRPHFPHANFGMRQFHGYRLSRQELQEANELDALEDVRFLPVGPPLNPLTYTNAIQVVDTEELCPICQCEFETEPTVQLRACGHIMHRECVREMINGVADYSNLCPLDRQGICPRRRREAAL
ncbi:hypothetical protein P171DRAFT_491568 [Karstenula rhodostoma CBS 690.94]|uniref:RING-type domain-containing protein n=1 Tax=Karstenula rhodostoma CBS 690.94 TaxID=1392251 RepID=A0A9P4P6C5_9PLEO|nr:hypothetical protein P171DRAFT_491568 [Karstenula rhodostoma CBS 690.94]